LRQIVNTIAVKPGWAQDLFGLCVMPKTFGFHRKWRVSAPMRRLGIVNDLKVSDQYHCQGE
jgi:hypothetical protein